MAEGFIVLSRGIFSHWVHDNSEYFRAWVDMIAFANFSDKTTVIDGELIECKRGQSVHSVKKWAEIFGKNWTEQKVRTFFKLLIKDEMISVEGLRKTTRVTILKYDTYNGCQRADNEQITNRQRTDNEQITTTELKELKELKKTKENSVRCNSKKTKHEYTERFEKFWTFYGCHGNKVDAFGNWNKLTEDQITQIGHNIRAYVESTPNLQYRKKAETYLNPNKEHWNDNIVSVQEKPEGVQILREAKFYGDI